MSATDLLYSALIAHLNAHRSALPGSAEETVFSKAHSSKSEVCVLLRVTE
uniref:Uncharacterized protein n=1 Tax=Ciona intestinalis TaxID=7719 RepID=F6WVD5_CIOIN